MEAEKSHDMPSAKLRTRNANGIIQSNPKGLRIGAWGLGRGVDGVSPGESLKTQEPGMRMPKDKGTGVS